jgi:hypothetical protein
MEFIAKTLSRGHHPPTDRRPSKSMSIALVTGSETSQRFHAEGFDLAGVDNDIHAAIVAGWRV